MADNEDYNKLTLQIALNTQELKQLSATMDAFIKNQDKLYQDHESRLRALEDAHGIIRVDIATMREKLTVAQLIQSAFTTIASAVAYFLGR